MSEQVIKKYTCANCGGIVRGNFTFVEIAECNKECKHCYFGTMMQRNKRKDLFKGTQFVIPKSEFEKKVPKRRKEYKEYKGSLYRLTAKERKKELENKKALESLFE